MIFEVYRSYAFKEHPEAGRLLGTAWEIEEPYPGYVGLDFWADDARACEMLKDMQAQSQLWSFRLRMVPQTEEDRTKVTLAAVEHGDPDMFIQAKIKVVQDLSTASRATSVRFRLEAAYSR